MDVTEDRMRCRGCGVVEPPWPYAWRFLEDGAALCPACKREVAPLRSRA